MKIVEVNYFDVLDSIHGKLRSLLSIARNGVWPDERCFAIRHDLDRGFTNAMKMARDEYKKGYFATYFVHTGRTNVYDSEVIKKLIKIQNMGHHIGYHCDALARHIEYPRSLEEIILKPVDFMRNKGLNIYGSAAHGSSKEGMKDWVNYNCWKECPKHLMPGKREEKEDFRNYRNGITKTHNLPPPQISLKDVGFEYEAYFLPRTHYLNEGSMDKKDEILNDFHDKKEAFLIFLAHPDLWQW